MIRSVVFRIDIVCYQRFVLTRAHSEKSEIFGKSVTPYSRDLRAPFRYMLLRKNC